MIRGRGTHIVSLVDNASCHNIATSKKIECMGFMVHRLSHITISKLLKGQHFINTSTTSMYHSNVDIVSGGQENSCGRERG